MVSAAFAGIASALVAGVFLAFSDFIMRSLTVAEPAAGIEAMQQINRKVYRSLFLVLLMGLAPVSLVLAIAAFWAGNGPAAVWLSAGAGVYLLGVIAVTMAGNVPMNKRLDRLRLPDAGAANYWREYGVRWTRLNHLRTLASALAAGLFLIGGAAALAA
jgi:uncharacterized membrane protein